MGIARGITAILKATSQEQTYEKVRWLKLNDKQAVKLRFINEMSEDSPHFDIGRDLAVVIEEHSSPKDFKIHAVCSMDDEGKCWSCEQRKATGDKVYGRKKKFYINVLVDDGVEAPYVAVWSMGTYRSPAFETIMDHFSDHGSISNLSWRLKRSGTGNNTTYLLTPIPDKEDFSWPEDVKPFDLMKIVRTVPYNEQAAFYGKAAGSEDEGEEESVSVSSSVDW